jgi:glutamyl-tRNA synthetase
VLLYRFLGWEDTMPQFAHLPLLLKPDGHGKLSKRDADTLGFPIFPLNWNGIDHKTGEQVFSQGYREAGYLPEALINFLAFLGWSPGTQQELFTMEELIESFSIERVGKAGVKFDINKAKWYNQQYLRVKPDEELATTYLLPILQDKGIQCSLENAVKISHIMKERVTFPDELWSEVTYLFNQPGSYDEQVVQSKWTAEAARVIADLRQALQDVKGTLTADLAKSTLQTVLDRQGVKIGKVMQALRLAVTGVGAGPDLMHIMEILGGEETTTRLGNALDKLQEKAK